ncbi:MAG: nucleotidyltransferase family protein [Prevotella sp.]|nr:nucleotidyltransferase family protein [Prevotella sp.]MBQ2523141.1 nucleotidyltransferase family protein [Prevotella sp.]MBQ2589378.1 nucleotidyltransferase family protein [Prevotella sp.]MBQ4175209.1 nucleotidyltransferase family protein [Prevotella sp.]MBQ4209662.1 nucleotidyltransferase family protein [Prevotella sp.]
MSTQMMNKVIADYFKTQPVQRAWLFGSFARGEQRPWSDVDILVEFDKEKPIGLLKFAGIICDLEDLIGHKVDLVEEGTLKSYAVESVNRDKKMIYEREEQG